MNCLIDYEIHFLINLPDFIKDRKDRIQQLYDEIRGPVMSITETGFLTGNCPKTDSHAIQIAEAREANERRISRAIERCRRLVNAINSLDVDDIEKLKKYYADDETIEIQAIFERVAAALMKGGERQ